MFGQPQINNNKPPNNTPANFSSLFSGGKLALGPSGSLFGPPSNLSAQMFTGQSNLPNFNTLFSNSQMFGGKGNVPKQSFAGNSSLGAAQSQDATSKDQEKKPNENKPNLFMKKEKKDQVSEKKQQAPSNLNFFQPSANPIPPKSQTAQVAKNSTNTGLFQIKAQSPLENKDQNKIQDNSAKLNSIAQSFPFNQSPSILINHKPDSLFGAPQPKNIQQKAEIQQNNQALKQKQGSQAQAPKLFSLGAPTSEQSKEKQAKKPNSLFQNLSNQNTPGLFVSQNKQFTLPSFSGSFFGGKKQEVKQQQPKANAILQNTLLASTQDKQVKIGSQTQGLFSKVSNQKPITTTKQTLIPPGFLSDQFAKAQKNEESKPSLFQKKQEEKKSLFRQPLFKTVPQKQKTSQAKALTSLFKLQSVEKKDEPKPEISSQEPLKAGQNISANQQRLQTEARNNEPIQSLSQNQQSKVKSLFSTDLKPSLNAGSQANKPQVNKNLDNVTRNTAQNANSQANQSFLASSFRSQQTSTKTVVDIKTLKAAESNQSFDLYLSQKRSEIIQSIKVYFSLSPPVDTEKQVDSKTSDKDRFYTDLTNLFINLNELDSKNYPFYQKFVKGVVSDEKYQQKLFIGNKFNVYYFQQNNIYWQDYTGKYTLNQNSSQQLIHLVQKILRRWNSDKTNFLNFVKGHPQLIKPKEDLFSYLFSYLLKLEPLEPRSQKQRLSRLKAAIRDYNKVTSRKLTEFLDYYNKKIGKSLKYLLTETPETYIISILPLVQRITNEKVINLSLKILLNSIDLSKPQKIPQNLIKAIKQTKSINLLPLRVIMIKLKENRLQFATNPKDLYKYIQGNEWIDWIDIYLFSGQKHHLELQAEQPKYIVQSIASISGNIVIERLIGRSKGIYSFFDLLKSQNMTEFYYKILQTCIYNDNSVHQIDQFYFKKSYFTIQYQELKNFIVNFDDKITVLKEFLESSSDVLKTMYSKISLISKIIEIQPQKIFDLQKYIFEPSNKPNKMLKIYEGVQMKNTQGLRMVHFFIDVINIVSISDLKSNIVAKVLKALTSLLKSKNTQMLVIKAMTINKPSFRFIQNRQLSKQTNQAVEELLDHIVTSSYIYDVIIGQSNNIQLKKMQLFYPLRYNTIEYSKLLSVDDIQQYSFSMYWISQLFTTASKQKFNPRLLQRLLNKLKIQPNRNDVLQRPELSKKTIPTLFQMIIKLVNSFNIWEQISRVLQYNLGKEEGSYQVINNIHNNYQNTELYNQHISTLKLIKTLFYLNQILVNKQKAYPNHFIVKILTRLNILNRIQIVSTVSTSDKGNFLLALTANIQVDQPLVNDSIKKCIWQIQDEEQEGTKSQALIELFKKFKDCLDLQQITNLAKTPENIYYQNQDNLTTLALQCIIYFLRVCRENCFEVALLDYTRLQYEEKRQIKEDIVKKLLNSLAFYQSEDEYKSIKYKILQFIYDLKFNLGSNKLNEGLADILFAEFLKTQKAVQDSRVNHLILQYFVKEIKQKRDKFENHMEQSLFGIINAIQFRDTHLNGYQQLRNVRQIGRLIEKYQNRKISSYNLNQVERVMEERAIVYNCQNLRILSLACQILIEQISKKKFSSRLVLSLNAVNKFIARKNLTLVIEDIPFDSFSNNTEVFDRERQLKRPTMFLNDPLEFILTEVSNSSNLKAIQTLQKNNMVEWVLEICRELTENITTYLEFILTIDKTFFANNPIPFDLSRSDLINKPIFYHLSLGTTELSSIDIFGQSQQEAVGIVQLISENVVGRLETIYNQIKTNYSSKPTNISLYIQGLKLLGFCIQWLRPRKKGAQSAANDVIRKINRNHEILLPFNTGVFILEQLKVLQSFLSVGELVYNQTKFKIQNHLYHLISDYCNKMGDYQIKDENFGLQAQQALSLLLLCPPACNQQNIHDLIIIILSKQKNQKYFFNQCRLLLELASLYPEQLAKLNVLNRFNLFEPLRGSSDHYQNNERKVISMKWLWLVQIASALISNSDSIIVINQVSNFVEKYKILLFKTIRGDQVRITRGYLQQLEATLNLFSFLISNNWWVDSYRETFEELTYIMSHNLLQFFFGVSLGNIKPCPISSNQIVLSEVNVSSRYQENQIVENYSHDQLLSVFGLEMKIKTVYCLRFYLLSMEGALQKSLFIQKYFHSFVSGPRKYAMSFWESTFKGIQALFIFTKNCIKYWLQIKRVKHIVRLINSCYNAPHTFVQNGFLTSVIEVPRTENELFSDLYLSAYLITKLAVTIFFQQKVFNNKFNILNRATNDHFGGKILQHIEEMGQVTSTLGGLGQDYVKYDSFKKLAGMLNGRTNFA